jgi:hypothetical protein
MKTIALSIIAGMLFATSFALVQVAAQAPVIGQGGASPQPPFVMRGNHVEYGGPTPKLAGTCGSTPVNFGNDSAGWIAFGSDAIVGNQCEVKFSAPHNYAACVATAYFANNLSFAFSNDGLFVTLVALPVAPQIQAGATYLCFDLIAGPVGGAIIP